METKKVKCNCGNETFYGSIQYTNEWEIEMDEKCEITRANCPECIEVPGVPTVKINNSEASELFDGQTFGDLRSADIALAGLDWAYRTESGYRKTDFTVDFGSNMVWNGRIDLGDAEGFDGIVNHIRAYCAAFLDLGCTFWKGVDDSRDRDAMHMFQTWADYLYAL